MQLVAPRTTQTTTNLTRKFSPVRGYQRRRGFHMIANMPRNNSKTSAQEQKDKWVGRVDWSQLGDQLIQQFFRRKLLVSTHPPFSLSGLVGQGSLFGGMFGERSARRMSPSARHKQSLLQQANNPGFRSGISLFPQRRSRRGNRVLCAWAHPCLMTRRADDEMGMPVSRVLGSIGQCWPVLASVGQYHHTRLIALLALSLQPLFWGHLFVRILQTAAVPFNLMHHHQHHPTLLALQWLQNVCQVLICSGQPFWLCGSQIFLFDKTQSQMILPQLHQWWILLTHNAGFTILWGMMMMMMMMMMSLSGGGDPP